MKDYYKILGVEEEASGEEIRARWIELTKHYHPDLGETKEADATIKEINEAYQVLKNESTRLEYDLRLALKKAHRRKRKMNRQKIILSAGILLFFLIVGLVIFRGFHGTAPPKSGVFYKIDKVLDKKTASQIPPAKAESKVMGEEKEESKRKEEPGQKILPKSEVPVKVGKEIPKEIRKEIPQERTEIASVPSSPSLSPAEKESKRKEELVPQVVVKSEMPVKVDKEAPKEATKVTPVTLQPGEKLQLKTKEEKEVPREAGKVTSQESAKSVPPPPLLAKEEEVRQFFSNYINRYNRKDIDGFLSFFSSKAIQNQKDGFEGIRKIYTNFFDQSQGLKYRLEDAKIEIYQNMVEVKARFKVEQILKKRGEEKIWKGNVGWVLVKEDGVLKIITLDYQNEKSP